MSFGEKLFFYGRKSIFLNDGTKEGFQWKSGMVYHSFHHNFPSNWSRNLILDSISMFIGTRNLMESSKKLHRKQGCQIFTAVLQKRVFRFILPPMCFNMGIFRGSGNLMK